MSVGQRTLLAALALSVTVASAGCSAIKPSAAIGGHEEDHAPYVIGLGEIMGLTQMRHAKLWFAGRAKNWDLARYELDELREGFDDARRYHPRHKSVKEPLTKLVPQYTDAPLLDVEKAIDARDERAFIVGYDRLTKGCNGCHEVAGFGFNVVTRPVMQGYSNQRFAPE